MTTARASANPVTSFTSFAPESTGRIGSVTQTLLKSDGASDWVEEEVPFTALYNALGQLTSFTATGALPVFQWGHTYTHDNNATRTGGTITANGASMSFTSGVQSYSNRQTDAAGITMVMLYLHSFGPIPYRSIRACSQGRTTNAMNRPMHRPSGRART